MISFIFLHACRSLIALGVVARSFRVICMLPMTCMVHSCYPCRLFLYFASPGANVIHPCYLNIFMLIICNVTPAQHRNAEVVSCCTRCPVTWRTAYIEHVVSFLHETCRFEFWAIMLYRGFQMLAIFSETFQELSLIGVCLLQLAKARC